jgi:hypothetical protein
MEPAEMWRKANLDTVKARLNKEAQPLSKIPLYVSRDNPKHDALSHLTIVYVSTAVTNLLQTRFPDAEDTLDMLNKNMRALDPRPTEQHDVVEDEFPLIMQVGVKLLGEGFYDDFLTELDRLLLKNPPIKV